jgi:hypothetical protein
MFKFISCHHGLIWFIIIIFWTVYWFMFICTLLFWHLLSLTLLAKSISYGNAHLIHQEGKVYPSISYASGCPKPGKWAIMYMNVRCVYLPLFLRYSIGFRNCFNSAVFLLSLSVHRLSSVVCYLFTFESSPLQPLGQMNRHLAGMIYRRSSIKIAHFVLIR